MEEAALNHVKTITRTIPAEAAQWQDVVCYGAQAIADFLTAFGESSPFINYLTNKCDLPLDRDGD